MTTSSAAGINALVVETAFPGDAIISLALAHELKRQVSGSKISYLVRPDAAEIIKASPHVDDVIVFDKRGKHSGLAGLDQIASYLREASYTHLFLLQNSRRNLELAKRLGIPNVIGFGSAPTKGLTQSIPEGDKGGLRTSRAISLLKPVVGQVDLDTLPVLSASLPDRYQEWFERKEVIAIAPGSAWPTKQWGYGKFRSLSLALIGEGFSVVLIGGKDDAQLGAFDSYDRILNAIAETSLSEAAGLIAASRLLIANDSAPLHLATATSTRSIGIFGPTVPQFGFAPPPELGSTIGLKALWCRPCTAHGSIACPIYTHTCMGEITVDHVLKEVLTSLRQHSFAS